MKIALGLFVNNDFRMLSRTLPYSARLFDSVILLDMGSTDNTEHFSTKFLTPKDVYHRESENWIPERGFFEARNLILHLARRQHVDWVFFTSADSIVELKEGLSPASFLEQLKLAIAAQPNSLIRVPCYNYVLPSELRSEPNKTDLIEKELAKPVNGKIEYHFRLIRTTDYSIAYRGYIHEEPKKVNGETLQHTVFSFSRLCRFCHLAQWDNNELRNLRYGYMLWRAYKDKDLREGTNSWWYSHHVPQNLASLEKAHDDYLAHVAAGKPR